MPKSQPPSPLNQLIDEAREEAHTQQAQASPTRQAQRRAPSPKGWAALLLLALFGVVLVLQYPRIQSPYTWPTAGSDVTMVDADLKAVAEAIDAYRVATGKYPETLGQVKLPGGLAPLLASSVLVYRPDDAAFRLEWTLTHWRASYDSKTQSTTVEAVAKH